MDTHMRSSAADRRRPTLWDGMLVLFMVVLSAALAFGVFPRQTSSDLTAVVTVDGKTVAILPLYTPAATEESAFFSIDDCPFPLVLEYKAGAIRVADAECPGKDCVHTGWITDVGAQIICLPNKLIITITGEGAVSFDAITG